MKNEVPPQQHSVKCEQSDVGLKVRWTESLFCIFVVLNSIENCEVFLLSLTSKQLIKC